MSTFAKIDPNQNPNVVINIQTLSEGDYQDPAFTWVDITNLTPEPQIGWTYSDGVFTAPGLPNDIYGYAVTMQTVAGNDVYTNSAGFQASVAHDASSAPAYLSLSKQDNISSMKSAGEQYIQSRYTDSTRVNLIGLYLNAQRSLLLNNRQTYLAQIYTWQNSIISYIATYVANVQAQTTPAAVLGIVSDFTQFTASDPAITVIGAISINS